MHQKTKILLIFTFILFGILIFSGINPYDRGTWILEVLPVIITVPLLIFTYQRFPLTTLLYSCIFIHAIVLIIGGMHTYARVPIGFDIATIFHIDRNPYDKIGHLFQGFVPAIAAREVFIRGAYVQGKKMLIFIVICVVLAISASYELLEWATALVLGQGADEFLGTQGDIWDTQSDIFCALLGAIMALIFTTKLHNQQIKKFSSS